MTRAPVPIVRLPRLVGTPDDVAVVAEVLAAAPTYSLLIGGRLPVASDATDLFDDSPPGVVDDAKRLYAVEVNGSVVGIADVVAGWPDTSTAMVGLLLLREDVSGQGLGRLAFDAIEGEVRQWHGVERMRAAVVESNRDVIGFWLRMGFEPTGDPVPYTTEAGPTQAHILIKPLGP